MIRYIALLRGVNISGKNKIPMPELKACLTSAGLYSVSTCLNSGNVLFSSENPDKTALAGLIRAAVRTRFGVDVPVLVIRQTELSELLAKAPNWWGTDGRELYDNLIFVLPGCTAEEIAARIGPPSAGLEQIFICGEVIFWSFDRKNYTRSSWWKTTARPGIGEHITIRTANTLRKLVDTQS